MNATVQLQVNQAKLVQNLALAFTNKTTFIAELMQNARRAGASEIHLNYVVSGNADGKSNGTLVIEDNGSGIQSWQDLLSLADSGWDNTIQAQERPYGVGFFSCISSAKSVKVESGQHKLEFDREYVMTMQSISVQSNDETVAGTRITLSGLPLDGYAVDEAVQTYARGFPVKVFFEDKEISRYQCAEVLRSTAADYEAVVTIDGLGLCAFRKPGKRWQSAMLGMSLYLLGIPVLGGNDDVIVHLDPSKFPARLPDRDKLIDQNEKVAYIRRIVKGWWLSYMATLKRTLSIEALWEAYPAVAAEMLSNGMLDDIDRVPGKVIGGVPRLTVTSWASGDSASPTGWISRQSIEDGSIVLCKGLCSFHEGRHALTHELAYHHGWSRLKMSVSKTHWLNSRIVDLEDAIEDVEVDYVSKASDSIYLDGVDVTVHLVDAVRLQWKGYEATITDTSVMFFDDDAGQDGTLIVPPGSGSWDAIAKISSFYDGGDYTDDDYMESGRKELEQLLMVLRGASPAASLMTIMDGSDYRSLANTQNSCVLVVNRQRTKDFHALEANQLLEAVCLYRKDGMASPELQGILEQLMKDMAQKAHDAELCILSEMVRAAFNKRTETRLLREHDPELSYEAAVQEQFIARVACLDDLQVLMEDIDQAVNAYITSAVPQLIET